MHATRLREALFEHYLKTVLPGNFQQRSLFVQARLLVLLAPEGLDLEYGITACCLEGKIEFVQETNFGVTLRYVSGDREVMFSRKRMRAAA